MPETRLILITGRSLKQGTGVNMGKDSAEYQQTVSTLEMNREDMSRLGIQDGDQVRLKTSTGEVVVRCQGAELPAGLVFMAYGPLTSQLMADETDGSGMPSSKGFEVEVERVG